MLLRLKEMKAALAAAQTQGVSMRRRMMIYLFTIIVFFALLIVMLLLLFGAITPIGHELERALDNQLKNSANLLERQGNDQAAYALDFSQQITEAVRNELADAGITFDQLRNHPDALESMQNKLFEIVSSHMLLTPCSGAFCFLNTTVNDTLPDKSYSGLYLKFANLYAENTIHNDVCLFRGFPTVAREKNMNLHSTWQLETQTEAFPEIDGLMSGKSGNLSESWFLTSVYQLPDTWESVRFLCIPVLDPDGVTIGVCGFEISSLYFSLSHKTMGSGQAHIFCALLTEESDHYAGQVAGNQSGYFPLVENTFFLDDRKPLTIFHSGNTKFIGKIQKLKIGTTPHLVAVMLPATEYQALIRTAQLKIAAFLFIAFLATLVSVLWCSKKYVAPILQGLEQIKTSTDRAQGESHVLEIEDLFAFLAEQDRAHEATLSSLQQERLEAQSRQERLQSKLEQASNGSWICAGRNCPACLFQKTGDRSR